MKRGFISQLLRNPIYAQADLDMYEFFKSQGTVVVNEATDFAGTNGCYLYQGRDVQERKNKHLKDQILVLAPSEGLVSSDTWLRCRKKLMANKTFQGGRKAKNTWLAGKVKCGRCGYALMSVGNPQAFSISAAPSGPTVKAVTAAGRSVHGNLKGSCTAKWSRSCPSSRR